LPRHKVEGGFEEILKSLDLSDSLSKIVRNMIVEAWTQRLVHVNEMKKVEKKIDEVEKEKLLAVEKMENGMAPKSTIEEILELCLRFLSSPWKIWDSGDLVLRKAVLGLTFSERLSNHREEGYRTPNYSLPFKVLGGIRTGNCEMVPLG